MNTPIRTPQQKEEHFLLAKFMGYETIKRGRNGWEDVIFNFHNSWDCLMPVYAKLFDLECNEHYEPSFDAMLKTIKDWFWSPKIEEIYPLIVEAIVYYNTNCKPKIKEYE